MRKAKEITESTHSGRGHGVLACNSHLTHTIVSMSSLNMPVLEPVPSRWHSSKGPLGAVLFAAFFAGLSQAILCLGVSVNAAPIGFFIVLTALYLRIVPVGTIEQGAKWLIARSAAFMIPPVVAVARAWPLLDANLLPLAVIIIGGTVLTAIITALAVEATCWVMRRGER